MEIRLDDLFDTTTTLSGLIVLNRPIQDFNQFKLAWDTTKTHLFADGGANRVYDCLVKLDKQNDFIPDYLTGDFDSLRPDVLEFYTNTHKTIIEKRPSQYQTDFGKCLDILLEQNHSHNHLHVIAIGALGGRVDQSFHSLFQLYRNVSNVTLYLLTLESLTLLVSPGESVIHCPSQYTGPTCGLIPLGFNDSVISTRGLRWDVTDWPTSFETQVSTNNLVDNESVWVKTNRPLIFTVQIKRD